MPPFTTSEFLPSSRNVCLGQRIHSFISSYTCDCDPPPPNTKKKPVAAALTELGTNHFAQGKRGTLDSSHFVLCPVFFFFLFFFSCVCVCVCAWNRKKYREEGGEGWVSDNMERHFRSPVSCRVSPTESMRSCVCIISLEGATTRRCCYRRFFLLLLIIISS